MVCPAADVCAAGGRQRGGGARMAMLVPCPPNPAGMWPSAASGRARPTTAPTSPQPCWWTGCGCGAPPPTRPPPAASFGRTPALLQSPCDTAPSADPPPPDSSPRFILGQPHSAGRFFPPCAIAAYSIPHSCCDMQAGCEGGARHLLHAAAGARASLHRISSASGVAVAGAAAATGGRRHRQLYQISQARDCVDTIQHGPVCSSLFSAAKRSGRRPGAVELRRRRQLPPCSAVGRGLSIAILRVQKAVL